VALLGLVSLIADVSGEMLSALLPFLLVTQGATGLALGLVDGVTEGTGDVFKLVGGVLAQRVRRTRLLIGSGYLVATVSRFGVALATTWPFTLALRSLDRVGKGLRTAPRDGLLANLVDRKQRARAFGLHLAADTLGGVIGVGIVVVLASAGIANARIILYGAIVGLLAILPLFWVTAKPPLPKEPERAEPSPDYNAFVLVSMGMSLGRISYLFYVVHAFEHATFGATLGLYVLYSVAEALSALPWGRLGDWWGKRRTIACGYVLFSLSAAFVALWPTPAGLAAGFTLLGLGSGCVDGNSRALAAQLGGARTRTTHIGEYHALTGLAGLLGGIAAGLLWDNVSHAAPFVLGAIVPLLAVLALQLLRKRFPHRVGPAGAQLRLD